MRFYKALQEKGQYFIKRNLKVDSLDELLGILDEFRDQKKKVLFRGQSEAKFMLYSSLQRLWIDHKLERHYRSYREIVDNLIANSRDWNSGLIVRYLKNAGWHEADMSILSIMQHYGVPTPLLDFTYDIEKSLYFATLGIDFSPPKSEIEKYFSIYYIFRNNPVLRSVNSKGETGSDLDEAMASGVTIIDNADEFYRIQNNLNILNQEGAFIFNSSPSDPLEKHYFRYVSKHRKSKDTSYPREIGGCININKNLVIPVRDHLYKNGIDRYSMFPDLNHIKEDCLNREWQRLAKEGALSARRDSNPRPAD